MDHTAPASRRPGVLTAALVLVGLGAAIALLDLLLGNIGIFSALFEWREHIVNVEDLMMLLAIPALVHLIALVATVWLLVRTVRRSRSGRVALATLMFCFVPGAAVNYLITEIFVLVKALGSIDEEQLDQLDALLLGSLIADGVLLLIALVAGILLVLRPAARYTDRP